MNLSYILFIYLFIFLSLGCLDTLLKVGSRVIAQFMMVSILKDAKTLKLPNGFTVRAILSEPPLSMHKVN